jgi:hypothetical protein
MNFSSMESVRNAGFEGFRTTRDLAANDCRAVPDEPGVYLVLRPPTQTTRFLAVSRGGHFKGRDPTVPVERLEREWVSSAAVLYIGKAGGRGSRATLRERLRRYLRFGFGEPVGHWGGRFIWQLGDHEALLIAWKPAANAPELEAELIREFRSQFGVRPFANLRG